MNSNKMQNLVIFLVMFLPLSMINAGNLVLKKNDSGHEDCLEYGSNSENASSRTSRIVYQNVQLTITKDIPEGAPMPLRIRAYSKYGVLIGESQDIHLDLLEDLDENPNLLTALLEVEINLAFIPISDLSDCVDYQNNSINLIDVTFRIFSQNSELPETADIFDHPDLEVGSNILESNILICCHASTSIRDWHNSNNNNRLQPTTRVESMIKLKPDQSRFSTTPKEPLIERHKSTFFKIFPNPTSSKSGFQMQHAENTYLRIRVFSSTGSERFHATYHSPTSYIRVNTSGWSPGCYYVSINTPSKQEILKLVLVN